MRQRNVPRERSAVDPTTVRLSNSFLLSDFIGCHSVYTRGLPNVFEDETGEKLEEGRYLAQQLLEPILAESPISVAYGYISLPLAREIVRYQSPEKPSYHQWNDGAACDIVVHKFDNEDTPPIRIAEAIDRAFGCSRLITYSESPFLCVATRMREGDQPRRAFYENRYMGKRGGKPMFVTVPEGRDDFFLNHKLQYEWRGAGYPTYHGGGRKQVQHYRVGPYSMLSDFLYSTEATIAGRKNCPTITAEWLEKFARAGEAYAWILENAGLSRLSIVRAFESPVWSTDYRYTWQDGFAIDFIPPEDADVLQVFDVARSTPGALEWACDPEERRIRLVGSF